MEALNERNQRMNALWIHPFYLSYFLMLVESYIAFFAKNVMKKMKLEKLQENNQN